MEQARLVRRGKTSSPWDNLRLSKFTPVPFREGRPLERVPEETQRPLRPGKEDVLVQSQAYRQQYGFNSIFSLAG